MLSTLASRGAGRVASLEHSLSLKAHIRFRFQAMQTRFQRFDKLTFGR